MNKSSEQRHFFFSKRGLTHTASHGCDHVTASRPCWILFHCPLFLLHFCVFLHLICFPLVLVCCVSEDFPLSLLCLGIIIFFVFSHKTIANKPVINTQNGGLVRKHKTVPRLISRHFPVSVAAVHCDKSE